MSNCKVIALTNQKGGVGKTTTTVNLGISLSNLSALMKSSAEAEMEEKLTSEKHKYQLNRSYIIGIVSRYVRSLLTVSNYKKQLAALITRIQRMRSIIRPDRHFKRISGHHGTTNGFYIRVNL